MTLFWIAAKDLALLLRDKKALVTLLATPLILTLVLGTALGALWSSASPPSPVYYLNEDEGELGSMLFSDVFTLPELADRFDLEEIADIAAARERVGKGEAVAFIHIPADFSSSLTGGEPASILVLGDPGSSIRVQIVESVVGRFAAEVSARQVIYQALAETAAREGGPPELHFTPEQVEDALASVEANAVFQDGFLRDPTATDPQAMDYYAAGIGVMYMLFTVSRGGSHFLQERRDKTLARMLQSPVHDRHIVGGSFLSIFLTGLLQFTIIIVVSTLIFRVEWGSLPGVAMLVFSAAFAATGVGLTIAAITKTAESSSTAGTFVVLFMSALGGSMFPIFAMPAWMQTLTRITINGWAIDGFMNLMFLGKGPASVLLHFSVLTGVGILLWLFAGRRLTREVGS